MIPGHTAPFEYLVHSFFEGEFSPGEPADCVVWANRGGGKTFLGAVATVLDLAFKPGITIRILAGSLEQAARMHEHLRSLFAREPLAGIVEGRITERRIRVAGGGSVELLAQSQASVRGCRVQKLRCDEVELFDLNVWEAAQLTTRSMACDGWRHVRGAIECFSTMHIPHGLMHRLVHEHVSLDGRKHRRVFKWGVLDVLGSCAGMRACEAARDGLRGCALAPDCDGSARDRGPDQAGHVSLEDVLAMRGRVSAATWESEMLCLHPRRHDAVLREFDPMIHVVDSMSSVDEVCSGAASPLVTWVGGMDFGFRSPMVMLWACVDGGGGLWIVDERIVSGETLGEHVSAIVRARWPRPAWIGIDPAGKSANSQTGKSDMQVLREAGLEVRLRSMTRDEGLALIRARLRPVGAATPRLFVHRRCRGLIESMERYHYPANRPESREPVKDGFDHAVDALRYLVTNLDREGGARNGNYMG